MKERSILFKGEMVRAILDGRKSQTRRIGKCQMDDATELGVDYIGHATKGTVAVATYRAFPNGGSARWGLCECPHGVPGDRLWVKETHWRYGRWVRDGLTKAGRQRWRFKASPLHKHVAFEPPLVKPKRESNGWHKRPSIFMPRWASRITLEIVSVRVERLQDISEEDAMAEGVLSNGRELRDGNLRYLHYGKHSDIFTILSARESYRYLWDSINGPGSWAKNPWVWVISFSRISTQ